MEIVFDKSKLAVIDENYIEYEKNDVSNILSDVCQTIDKIRMAKFELLFAEWDSRFSKVDFAYDFISVASELEPLKEYLENQTGTFVLDFYELDRKLTFEFIGDSLKFTISYLIGDNTLNQGTLEPVHFKNKVINVIHVFKFILNKYFPKATKSFIDNDYLFSSWE